MADIGFANVEVLSATNTKVLAINNTRVSLKKGYGLMTPIATFEVAVSDILNALDVQPVKRGRWIDCTFYDPYEKSYEQNFEYKCSCCGHMIYNKPNDDNQYCGHCGARMDLKDGDTE